MSYKQDVVFFLLLLMKVTIKLNTSHELRRFSRKRSYDTNCVVAKNTCLNCLERCHQGRGNCYLLEHLHSPPVYPFAYFFRTLYCQLFFDLRLLITTLVSFLTPVDINKYNNRGISTCKRRIKIQFYMHIKYTRLNGNRSLAAATCGAGTAYPSGSPEFTTSFSGVRVDRSSGLCVCFVDRCLSFCTFSFGHCVVCSFSIYGF